MIDYQKISDSVKFYESKGFERIEAPWTVSQYTANLTKPEFKKYAEDNVLTHNNKSLVASGEQSFLYLSLKNFLPKGKYQAVTPCFRNESFDLLHCKYFMKNELIITDKVSHNGLMKVVNQALVFFSTYIDIKYLEVEKTGDEEYDINCFVVVDDEVKHKVELGSYGIRESDFLTWIYATGLAEPRLSRVLNLLERNGLPQK